LKYQRRNSDRGRNFVICVFDVTECKYVRMLTQLLICFDDDWQAAMLLDAPKASADDVADISSSCFKLNSLQLRALLSNYFAGRDEMPISYELIERAVSVAQNTADALARKEGAQVALFEDIDLHLPFLLPEDGYSCDFVKGLSDEMMAFLDPFQRAGE
jgi:afadin